MHKTGVQPTALQNKKEKKEQKKYWKSLRQNDVIPVIGGWGVV